MKRILGLRRLPDVATVSRALAGADQESVRRLQGLLRDGFSHDWRPLSFPG
ncbi:MAG: hypothetical protein H0T87_00190 [Gammaproteobacteria bacterium]|nr:hypothetical protein [Gammaproteobacteria bacterium]